jgi:hypothetical protein
MVCRRLLKLRDTSIVQAEAFKTATFSLSFLLLAVASSNAQTPSQAPHDFISWLHQVGGAGAQRPRARIGAHLPSLPLPRPRPAELAAVPPQAEAVSAKPNEQPESTSPAVADNTRTGAHPPAGPGSPDAPNNVQAEPASPAAPNKAKSAVLIND